MGVGWLANKQNPRHRWNSEKRCIVRNYDVMRAGGVLVCEQCQTFCGDLLAKLRLELAANDEGFGFRVLIRF